MESAVRNAVASENISSMALAEGPRIVVMGCGGAGNNSLNRMARLGVAGAEPVVLGPSLLLRRPRPR